MLDHDITSLITQTACFSAGIKNMDVPEEHFEPIPSLYYCDPIEGKDRFGELIQPSFCVDISNEIEIKTEMLACHESQRQWLDHDHILEIHRSRRQAKPRQTQENTISQILQYLLCRKGHEPLPQPNLWEWKEAV